MQDAVEELSVARQRIVQLEAELVAAREGVCDLERQIQQSISGVADLQSQVEIARRNGEDLQAQLDRAVREISDLVRQLDASGSAAQSALRETEATRIRNLHLVERLQSEATTPVRLRDRLFGRRESGSPLPRHIEKARRRIGRRFLRGRGLEIGALHSPIAVARGTQVTYVDRESTPALRRSYPEWSSVSFVEVDLVDDGERLEKVPDASQDFVIASHMLEHCENPLGTMRNHFAKLRPGGVLFYIIPDRRKSFDQKRPLTEFEHLVEDDRAGPEGSRWDHYLEFAALASDISEDQVEFTAQRMLEAGSSIHFHVWEDSTFRDFLEQASEYLGEPFSVEHFELNHTEVVCVLRKGSVSGTEFVP
jgi:SAM-dependent methyltransferase